MAKLEIKLERATISLKRVKMVRVAENKWDVVEETVTATPVERKLARGISQRAAKMECRKLAEDEMNARGELEGW